MYGPRPDVVVKYNLDMDRSSGSDLRLFVGR